MKAAPEPLVRHLALAVVVKLAVLTALWWAFVREEQVSVDVDRAATHWGGAAVARPVPSATSGATP